jgi:hypothetical protein
MSGFLKPNRSECARLRRRLSLAETQAVAVRKRLKQFQQTLRRRGARGSTDDAVRLCGTIERLARFGRSRPAAEAVGIILQIETLVSVLQAEVDSFLAS